LADPSIVDFSFIDNKATGSSVCLYGSSGTALNYDFTLSDSPRLSLVAQDFVAVQFSFLETLMKKSTTLVNFTVKYTGSIVY